MCYKRILLVDEIDSVSQWLNKVLINEWRDGTIPVNLGLAEDFRPITTAHHLDQPHNLGPCTNVSYF